MLAHSKLYYKINILIIKWLIIDDLTDLQCNNQVDWLKIEYFYADWLKTTDIHADWLKTKDILVYW